MTEGEDQPFKYPPRFRASQVMILTKSDLLPYLTFDLEHCLAYACQVNLAIASFQVSATTGPGLGEWYAWLQERQKMV